MNKTYILIFAGAAFLGYMFADKLIPYQPFKYVSNTAATI